MGRLQAVTRNKKQTFFVTQDGVSLVEVMIALVVLLLVFMGLLQAALLGIDSNMRNIIRDEAVTVAAMRMEEARSMPFDTVVDDTAILLLMTRLSLLHALRGSESLSGGDGQELQEHPEFSFWHEQDSH